MPVVGLAERGGAGTDAAAPGHADDAPLVLMAEVEACGAERSGGHSEEVTPREPAPILVIAAFTVVAFVLAFPNPTRLRSSIVGSSSDALLNVWIMRSVQHALPLGWHALWNLPIYHPAPNTLAYSDTLFPVALVHWLLRLPLGDTIAFNVIYVGVWVLSSWWMYRLAGRFVGYWGAAFVAALVYTYSSVRLAQHVHFQLVVGGALVPLVLLVFVRLLERPTPLRGAVLGLTVASLILTASYYGPMMAMIVVIVAGGWLVLRRPAPVRDFARAVAVAAVVVAALDAPFVYKYLMLERDPYFWRSFEPFRAAHVKDFLAGGAHNYVLSHVPFLSTYTRPTVDVEHRMFPGFVAITFGVIGIGVCVHRWRRSGIRSGRRPELFLLGVAALVFLVLSFGDWSVIAGHRVTLPFTFFRGHVPGYAGVRALSRLALPAELVLALLAAVGIQAVVRHMGPRQRLLVTIALSVLVVAESAVAIQFIRIPTSRDDGGVDIALRHLPQGTVVELPIASPAAPLNWLYIEPSRQLLALRDSDPRINGYSGFAPPGFVSLAAALNTFPQRRALDALRKMSVRYVVIRTRLVGDVTPSDYRETIEADGVGRYQDATARRLIAELPPNLVSHIQKLPGAYLIELK